MKHLILILTIVSVCFSESWHHRRAYIAPNGEIHVMHPTQNCFTLQGACKYASFNNHGAMWVLNKECQVYVRQNSPWKYKGTLPGTPKDICANGYYPTVATSTGIYLHWQGYWWRIVNRSDIKKIATYKNDIYYMTNAGYVYNSSGRSYGRLPGGYSSDDLCCNGRGRLFATSNGRVCEYDDIFQEWNYIFPWGVPLDLSQLRKTTDFEGLLRGYWGSDKPCITLWVDRSSGILEGCADYNFCYTDVAVGNGSYSFGTQNTLGDMEFKDTFKLSKINVLK